MKEYYADLAQTLRGMLPAVEDCRDIAARDEQAAEQQLAKAYAANPTLDDDEYEQRFGDLHREETRLSRLADDTYRLWQGVERAVSAAERLAMAEEARP